LYQPQVGQTTWGSLAEEQFGQRLRDGATSFQLEARRLRLFALLVFFLGTAIAGSYSCFRWDRARIVASEPRPVVGFYAPPVDEDPGWPPLWKWLLPFVVPGLGMRRPATVSDGLLALRSIFIAFARALVAIFVVCLIVSAGTEQSSPVVPGLLVLAWAGASQALAQVLPRPLACTDERTLGSAYRTRFFLRIALYESAALMGFVAVILTWHPELYLIGAASAAIGFARTAPTAANLEREQLELQLAGCPHSLVAAIRTTPPRT
jgi:hypothetical protein